jgi:hypothetical protein
MNEDLIKILCIIGIIGVFIYFITSLSNNYIVEGLENISSDVSANIQSLPVGATVNASNYATIIKNLSTQLQDSLLVSKYRTDYENVIINMEDLVNNLMLRTTLNINANLNSPGDVMKQLNALNTLQQSKTALNSVMKFIDSGSSSKGFLS